MAAYLWRYGLIESRRFIAEQGHWLNRPGLAFVEIQGSRDDIEGVRVGGQAVVVMRGEFIA
jgi:trans-2,3-dihydro-3-hydroxyanthranilate isomerase